MTLVFLPLFASLAGWLVSGSPVSMGLTVLLVVASVSARLIMRRTLGIWVPLLLSLFATVAQIWIFQSGIALDSGTPLPSLFHASMALLWFSASRTITSGPTTSDRRIWIALAGSLALIAFVTSAEMYEYSFWQVYSVAGLPLIGTLLSIFDTGKSFFPAKLIAGGVGILAVSLLLFGVRTGVDAIDRTIEGENEAEAPFDMGDAPSDSNETGPQTSASRRLPRKADISFDGKTQVYLSTTDPTLFNQWVQKPIYLRTHTLAVFESDEFISPAPTVQWIYDIDDGTEDNAVELTSDTRPPLSSYSVYIDSAHATQLPLLEHSEKIFCNAVYEFADDWYQLAPRDDLYRLKYTVSVPLRMPEPYQESEEELSRFNASKLYLNLPPSPLAARIAGLSKRFDTSQPLQDIQAHMRRNMRYSLKFETPENSNPIAEFLFHNQPGHCEHFATATVMILRSLGIPSRIAYGYSGGIADSNQRVMAFRDSDFHAWAEILTPDNKWVVFDTTPYVADSSPRLPLQGNVPALAAGGYYDYSGQEVAPEHFNVQFVDLLYEFLFLLSQHIVAVSLTGFLIVGALWFFFFRTPRKKSSETHFQKGSAKQPPLQFVFLEEIEAAGKEMGVLKKPGTTWREFLSSMQSQIPDVSASRAAIDYTYAVVYAGERRDKSKEQLLTDSLRQWRESLTEN